MNDLPELPRHSPEHQWFADIDRVVHQYDFLRLDSGWSGRAFENPARGSKGTVTFDADRNVIIGSDLLRAAMRAERGTTDVAKRREAYDAALKMVHTSVLMTRFDPNYRPAPGHRPGDPGTVALARGLAQAWALQNLRKVVSDADLALKTPRMNASRVVDTMPHYTAAANALVTGVAGHIGRSTGPVFRELVETPPSQRFNRVADWVMSYHSLNTAFPPAQRDAMRRELADLTHGEFAKVAGIPDRLAAMEGGKGTDGIALRSAMTQRGIAAGGRGSLVNIVETWMTAIDRQRFQVQPPAATAAPSGHRDPYQTAFAGNAPATGAPGTRPSQPAAGGQSQPQHGHGHQRAGDGGRRNPGADPYAR